MNIFNANMNTNIGLIKENKSSWNDLHSWKNIGFHSKEISR